jgi:hypothetical protein
MVTTSNFQKFSRDLDVIFRVFEHLYAPFTGVVFRPGVTVQTICLVTSVASLCAAYIFMSLEIILVKKKYGLTANRLVILRPKPHETGHEGLG